MIRRALAACAVLGAAGGATPAPPPAEPAPLEVGWREVDWPLPLDPWPAGRAFGCAGAPCAPGARLLARPKPGLCNCAAGVDDDEIDRLSDLAALGVDFAPLGPSWPVAFGAFTGRARRYALAGRGGRPRFALAVAAARGCDLVVALAEADAPLGADAERAALHHLAAPPLADWLAASTGEP